MSKIVSKLDLNKTPQLVDNNSLMFAKNIRILKDGIIGPDFPIQKAIEVSGVILGYIVGLDSTVYLFVAENSVNNTPLIITSLLPVGIRPADVKSYTLSISSPYNSLDYVYNSNITTLSAFINDTLLHHFGGTITQQGVPVGFKLFSKYPFASTIKVSWSYMSEGVEVFDSKTINYDVAGTAINYDIYKYDEIYGNLDKLTTAWHWSGGKIHGICTTNNTGDTILTVCEYFDNNDKLVPIKHINLSHSDVSDETLYTQAPNIPFTNLNFVEYYINPIPNGVYQFFIRYKIYKDFYTDWFPCSGECFSGTKHVTNTIQGSIQYIDTTLNSNESFVFDVEHLLNGTTVSGIDYTKNFDEFQIGFIVSHDDSINARAWKHFPMSTTRIYFDYDKEFITEINIDDLLKSVYEITNVKNITYFRNKLYISNYVESNINEDLSHHAYDVDCELIQKEIFLDNVDLSEQITIDNKTYPVIPDTSSPELYNLEGDSSIIINKTIKDNIVIPQSDEKGLLYKAYYKAWPGLDPDQFFLKSGYDCSIENNNALRTFCLIPTNDDEDFEDLFFYNNQTTTSANAGRLVYFDAYDRGYDVYSRVIGEPDTKIIVNISDDNRTIYVHPLNDDVDWFCFATDSDNLRGKIYGDIGNSNDSSYRIVALKKPENGYSNKYCIETDAPDWDEEGLCKNWDKAETYISNQLLTRIQSIYPKYVLKAITLYSNNQAIPLISTSSEQITRQIQNIESESPITITSKPYNDFRGTSDKNLGYTSDSSIGFINWCTTYVSSHVIDANGNAYYIHENNYYKIDRVEIEYNEFDYTLGDITTEFHDEGGLDDGEVYNVTREINSSVKKHFTTIYYTAKKAKDLNNESAKISVKSLLPFTDYKFYIHYIKRNGVVTNGYQIGNGAYNLSSFDDTLEHSVIYPIFDNISLPDGYDGCFFSIEKVGDNIASCFNYRTIEDERVVDCLEIDSMLYPLNDHISIIDSTGTLITDKAKYYPSSTTEPPMLLGNVGCIRWNVDDEIDYSDDSVDRDSTSEDDALYSRLWVRIRNNSESSVTHRLIKLTPYLYTGIFGNKDTDYDKLNIPGYYCSVCKPVDVLLNNSNNTYLYVNVSDLYEKKEVNDAVTIDDYGALMTHLDTYNSTPYYVYSNFNLSYLTLFDMSYKQVKYKRYLKTDEDTGVTVENYKQMLFMLDSSTISYIYTLPAMYKDYTRKLYSAKQNDKLYVFNNVIRSSDITTDETYKYIYKFDALDYYTVPANKGKIVNLFNITQSIFIHCEHSLFKFSGANTLSAKDTEVQLTENDVFDTGILELFDAKYGFAGLQNKNESLVTFNAYIFYDSIANIIYGYFGENNLVNISESIYKLIKNRDIFTILFTSDVENDRFFANIIYNDYKNICLSFNFNTKSFTSIHDFNFNEGFYSRRNCYFLDGAKRYLYSVNKLEGTTNYSGLYKLSKLFNNDMHFDGEVVENCLDIVCNVEYEKIKLINYINWICCQINQYADNENDINLFVAEENISKYAGSKLRIYSDQCSTELIELENSNGEIYEQNTQSISNPNSYIYPRYNCGVWSFNYFRDIKNIEDIFKYKDAIPPTQQEEAYNRGLINSDRSLIYGKYFVLRLIFRNKNFKLENINFNIQDYEKV